MCSEKCTCVCVVYKFTTLIPHPQWSHMMQKSKGNEHGSFHFLCRQELPVLFSDEIHLIKSFLFGKIHIYV
ncbi:hypothetical protein PHAVU_010G151666 [Phaseolus vulgaris]|uniref:Uncharacterized protein n=1 Tax=Phaseolus vulgaris TaxID=3885 RepID=V7D3M0_PHAVU|nr:hypothetical protein PHAVU_L010100g [Phaseolus vulgaris]ESW35856.1 hypothetical protein PHAVU_L010100g [Phaseolus vulgaris]